MVEHPLAAPHRAPLDVAVIIPAFDAGQYVDQALASVAAQTRAPAVVVVADDGSSDDTAERASRWRDRLPIEVLRLEHNLGPGPARHQAILTTGTAMLAMLDADDLLLPDHLETMVATCERNPGLVTAWELSWMLGRGIDVDRRRTRRAPPPDNPDDQLVALLERNYVNFGFFPRALYDQAGGFRDFPVGEDWDLWIRMLRAGGRVTRASHATALHRVRPGSLSIDPRRTVGHGIAVLTAAVTEARTPRERAAAERGLRGLMARRRYYEVLALAGDGHPWRARLEAMRAPRGGGARIAAGLAAMAVAPRTSLRIERATRPYRVFGEQ
jgi:glycosyltransferase involved in cell wall biosynthesis